MGCQAVVIAIVIIQNLGTLIFGDCLKIFWNELKYDTSGGANDSVAMIYRELQVLGNVNNDVQGVTTFVLHATLICISFCVALQQQLQFARNLGMKI